MTTLSKECPICADTFTTHLRKPVECPYCDFSACIQCTKRYLIESMRDPHCMNRECNVGWNNDFVVNTFTKSWYNGDYQARRRELLFSREEARLQETMELLQFLDDVSEFYDNENERVQVELAKLHCKSERLQEKIYRNRLGTNDALTKESNEIWRLRDELTRRKMALGNLTRRAQIVVWGSPLDGNDMQNIQNVIYNGVDILTGLAGTGVTLVQRKVFKMPCPKEWCHGFLSQRYKCGVCQVYVCPQCHEAKSSEEDTEHMCDEDTVKTVQLIRRDSMPCPTCHILIYRNGGCDQMWCTQCKVAFNWRTGRIEHGVIHNPHYADWARQNNGALAERDLAIRACGVQLDVNRFIIVFREFGVQNNDHLYDLTSFVQTLAHFEAIIMPSYQRSMTNGISLNRFKSPLVKSRIMPSWELDYHWEHIPEQMNPQDDPNRRFRLFYLLGLIPKETAKTLLQKQEKNRNALSAWYTLYEMFVNTGKDIMVRLESFMVENHQNKQLCLLEAENIYKEVVELGKYLNKNSLILQKVQGKQGAMNLINKRLKCIQDRTLPSVDELPNSNGANYRR